MIYGYTFCAFGIFVLGFETGLNCMYKKGTPFEVPFRYYKPNI